MTNLIGEDFETFYWKIFALVGEVVGIFSTVI